MRRVNPLYWCGILARNGRGVAAIEFALVAPVTILLYVGSYQLADAIGVNRKVTVTARSLADLTTQYTSLTQSEADSILNAATQVMSPYDSAPGTYRISELAIDNAGAAKVVWSKSRNGTARTVNSTVALPSGVAQTNSYIVMAEVSYTYVPRIAVTLIGNINIGDTIYMYPRRSNSISLQ
ncbi:MAG TPA: TadE/TadG family type IV pilus assembly protein [Sphingobium sp.]